METVEGQIIEERDIIDVTPEQPEQPEQPEEECKTCKQKGLTKGQWIMLSASFYILFSAIYGTIKIIKELINYVQ
tara:strand:- start:612 stop:836 length:225 start_codon:yes stop_codon:yes gene_type:complete